MAAQDVGPWLQHCTGITVLEHIISLLLCLLSLSLSGGGLV